jgi:hypothetical protein
MTKTQEQVLDWLFNGETGLSSECMAAVALATPHKRRDHPLDPADFNRCLKLVKHAPGVRRAFPVIRKESKQWRKVIDHWDELEEMFVGEVGWNWSKAHSAPQTYDRMKALGL